ncbi:hypothetical protein BC829DRAFT_445562 [Chytridium lagenaria]|nr:hypothetical protein BC829DRAFT_445562 [Chytridium lagenaria]
MSTSSAPSNPSHPKSTYKLLTAANKQKYYPEWKALVLDRLDASSLPTKYYARGVLKMSDQLVKKVQPPPIPSDIVVANVVTNIGEIELAVEKARQWNEVEYIIKGVLVEHMDDAMRAKFNVAMIYDSIHSRFKAFELYLHHDASQTIEAIRDEMKRLVQGYLTPLEMAEEFEEKRNKLVALGTRWLPLSLITQITWRL